MGGGGSRPSPPSPWRAPTPPWRDCDRELNDTRNNYNNQINDLRNQLNNKQNEVNNKQNEINWLYRRAADLQRELEQSKQSDAQHVRELNDWREKYDESQRHVAELEAEIARLNAQIEDLRKRVQNLKESATVSSDTANAAIRSLEKFTPMDTVSESFESESDTEPMREGLTGLVNDLTSWLNTNNNIMYDSILAQNTTLENQIQDMKNEHTTDDQRTVYQLQQNTLLNRINVALLVLYYALFLVFCYLLFKLYKKKALSNAILAAGFVVVAIYPWVIGSIESFLYFMARFAVALAHGNVFGQ
jgi:peptidoglycan hydrolase CwlO-like protein